MPGLSDRTGLSDRSLGLLAGISSSAIVGLVSLLIFRAASTLPAAEITFARGAVGACLTLPLVGSNLPQLLRRASMPVWVRAIAGVVSVLCFSWNLQHTSIGMANMLFNISLLLLLIIGTLSDEVRFTIKSVVALAVTALGTWVYWYGVNPTLSTSVLLVGSSGAIAAALAYTAMKKATRVADPLLMTWAACVASLPISFLAPLENWSVPSTEGFVILLVVGLGMLLSQYLLVHSFTLLPLPLASALIPSSIVWGVLGEAFTTGAHATLHAIAGTATYAGGICGLAAEGNRKTGIEAAEPAGVEPLTE